MEHSFGFQLGLIDMKTVTLIFTQEQLEILNAALVEIPYRVAAPLISDINKQIKDQAEEPSSNYSHLVDAS
jgi:hypothetical protein